MRSLGFHPIMVREYLVQAGQSTPSSRIDYAQELNPAQLAAVTAPPGPALVIAGAGSGKTRTLIYRVAFLLEQGIAPERILLLTFTNKAAGEMMRRVAQLMGHEIPGLWGGTFHAIGNRILRRHAEAAGFPSGFTIQDRDDAKAILKTCLAEAGLEPKGAKVPKPEVLGDLFSLAVNKCEPLRTLVEAQYPWFIAIAETLEAIQGRYAARKRTQGMMDFDDLLVLWLKLMRDSEDVRDHYQQRFQFILVDEYQDTNPLQAQLIDLLAARHRNLMVVGDDAQSIYSWRGADFQNILGFARRHSGAQVYKVETNYRSTPEILALANAVIAGNTQQLPKALVAARPSGAKPALVACGSAAEQSGFVAQRAVELQQQGIPLREMVVLYRSHFHSLELQMELTRRGIPFSITSGIRFFEQAHAKDVVAYLRWLTNPLDEVAFVRLALMLPGIGPKAAQKLWRSLHSNCVAGTPRAAALKGCCGVPQKAQSGWGQLVEMMAKLEAAGECHDVGGLVRIILESGYKEYVTASYDRAAARLEELEELAVFAQRHESAESFLAELALLSNIESQEERSGDTEADRLRLSTIHQAKGLEFQVVFVIMLCEGMFPSARATEDSLEEERRLFYVAATRAKEWLHLCHPYMRSMAAASGEGVFLEPSRFLTEVPEELMEAWRLRSAFPGE